MTRWQRRIYNFFNPRGRTILKAVLSTMCADDPAVLTRVKLSRVILRTEKYISELPFFYFLMIKLSLYLMEYALPPLSWKLLPFSMMGLERRLRYLEEWQSSSFYPKRIIFRAASAVCLVNLYSERRLLTSIGFESGLQNRIAHQWSLTARR